MVSSKSKSKSKAKKGSNNSRAGNAEVDTSEWNEWEWNENVKAEYRSRQKPDGGWEYEYRQPETRAQEQPRNLPQDLFGQYNKLSTADGQNYTNEDEEEEGDSTQLTYGLSQSQRFPTALPTMAPAMPQSIGGMPISYASTPLMPNYASAYPASVTRNSAAPTYSSAQTPLLSGSSSLLPGIRRNSTVYDPFAHEESQSIESRLGKASLAEVPHSQRASEPSNQSVSTGSGRLPSQEALDSEYKVHHARHFKPGQIFKVLWTEPMGQNSFQRDAGGFTDVVERRPVRFGEFAYTSIRRMAIIRTFKGHCVCLPIMTYNLKATTKSGVTASDHAVVYVNDKKHPGAPRLQTGETLVKQAIRVEPRNPRVKLDSSSRLNFAKPHTVEYNLKVAFIGKIHRESERYFFHYYNAHHPVIDGKGGIPEVEEEDEEEDEENQAEESDDMNDNTNT